MKPRERDITARYYQAGSPHSEINSDGYFKNFYRVIDKVLNQYFKGGIFVYVKKIILLRLKHNYMVLMKAK